LGRSARLRAVWRLALRNSLKRKNGDVGWRNPFSVFYSFSLFRLLFFAYSFSFILFAFVLFAFAGPKTRSRARMRRGANSVTSAVPLGGMSPSQKRSEGRQEAGNMRPPVFKSQLPVFSLLFAFGEII
jgi:hypothetical protein